MSRVHVVIDRLAGVRQSGQGRWMAKCPAHKDDSASLSIRERDDGRILLHDFAGCATGDVLAALGLQFTDLFPDKLGHYLPPVRGGFYALELLGLIAHETDVAMFITQAALAQPLTESQRERLQQCAARIGKARALADPNNKAQAFTGG